MNWQEKKSALVASFSKLTQRLKVSGEESPEDLRKKQYVRLGVGSFIGVMGAAYGMGVFDTAQPPAPSDKKPEKPLEQKIAELPTPLSGVKDGDLWVSRIEKLVKNYREELDKVRAENVVLEKKINTLVGGLGGSSDQQEKLHQALNAVAAAGKVSETTSASSQSSQSSQITSSSQSVSSDAANSKSSSNQENASSSSPQHFPSFNQSNASDNPVASSTHSFSRTSSTARSGGSGRKKRKLLHLSGSNLTDHSHKPADAYLPAGTYFKVVTAGGVIVSTGTNASADPQPIFLRIVDNGNLPGGLKSRVKDAVVIGSCYGSASAERAICRLKTLSWRDKLNNRTIEKPVEGWILSEDGVQGIRAKIIDRSSEIAREAFGAGLLSAAANFFKMEATSGVYPMTPFGQTNALSKTDAVKAGIGGGVGSAMDKLAEFSIKRAESMSPVAYVASGRVLDAVLMRGVDLSPVSQENLQLVSSGSNGSSTSTADISLQPQGESQ